MRILLVETRVLIPTITPWFIGIPGEIEDNRKNLQAGWCPNSNRAKVANEKETRVRGRTAGFKTHHRSPILIYKDGWIAGQSMALQSTRPYESQFVGEALQRRSRRCPNFVQE